MLRFSITTLRIFEACVYTVIVSQKQPVQKRPIKIFYALLLYTAFGSVQMYSFSWQHSPCSSLVDIRVRLLHPFMWCWIQQRVCPYGINATMVRTLISIKWTFFRRSYFREPSVAYFVTYVLSIFTFSKQKKNKIVNRRLSLPSWKSFQTGNLKSINTSHFPSSVTIVHLSSPWWLFTRWNHLTRKERADNHLCETILKREA